MMNNEELLKDLIELERMIKRERYAFYALVFICSAIITSAIAYLFI